MSDFKIIRRSISHDFELSNPNHHIHNKTVDFKEFLGTEFDDHGEVGWGFSGLVLKSHHRSSNRLYARKIIHETSRTRQPEEEASHKEVDFYRKISQEGVKNSGAEFILKCYGEMKAGIKGHIHGGLVFEYMEFGSLADILKNKGYSPFPEPIILRIAQSLLKACAYLDDIDLVHRDIKPSNILVDRNGMVKLCDFGEACYKWESEDPLRGMSKMSGSAAYMSPERLTSKPHSTSADIWSVGLVILELTHGSFPFKSLEDSDISLIELWEMIMESDTLPAVPPFKFSSELCDLVTLCMKKDPELRPSARHLLETFTKSLFINMCTPSSLANFIIKS